MTKNCSQTDKDILKLVEKQLFITLMYKLCNGDTVSILPQMTSLLLKPKICFAISCYFWPTYSPIHL